MSTFQVRQRLRTETYRSLKRHRNKVRRLVVATSANGKIPAVRIKSVTSKELWEVMNLVRNGPELLARFGKLSAHGFFGREVVFNAYRFARDGELKEESRYGRYRTASYSDKQAYLLLGKDIEEDFKRRLNELFGDTIDVTQRRQILAYYVNQDPNLPGLRDLYELLDLLPSSRKRLVRYGELTAVGECSQICVDIAYRIAGQGLQGEDFPELEKYSGDGLFLVMKMISVFLADAITQELNRRIKKFFQVRGENFIEIFQLFADPYVKGDIKEATQVLPS